MTLTQGAAGAGSPHPPKRMERVAGKLPYRVALAGGWIDQPFISSLNPEPPGSMVVVSLRPTVQFMDRAGMATGTRHVARKLWGEEIPGGDPLALVRELFEAENRNQAAPSGSQDMAGLIFPGISRLDYDVAVDGGTFPSHVESNTDAETIAWLESVLHLILVAPRPPGYDPLVVKNLDPGWVKRLGASGRDCFDAIARRDLSGLGASMLECSLAWNALLPGVFSHPTITLDLKGLLARYQAAYSGAMYSGCGGGYLIVASEGDVPGSFKIAVRA